MWFPPTSARLSTMNNNISWKDLTLTRHRCANEKNQKAKQQTSNVGPSSTALPFQPGTKTGWFLWVTLLILCYLVSYLPFHHATPLSLLLHYLITSKKKQKRSRPRRRPSNRRRPCPRPLSRRLIQHFFPRGTRAATSSLPKDPAQPGFSYPGDEQCGF